MDNPKALKLEYNVVCLKTAHYGLVEPFESYKSIHLRMSFFEDHCADKIEGTQGFARLEIKNHLLRRLGGS
jgi:hypothetical protein